MNKDMHPSRNRPAPISFTLLAVLLTLAPQGTHAQSLTPSHSVTSKLSPEDYGYLAIVPAIVVLLMMFACCSACCVIASPLRSPVRDVEKQPPAFSGQTQIKAQETAVPAPPPQAHTKEKQFMYADAAKEWEPSPPPYYPPPSLPPPPAPALRRVETMPT